jgi:3-isopropylmalate/(R)-2-methylmalate dehydratase small subunit
MEPIATIAGRVSVLARADVDTDQIMPKQFLKRIERVGFGEFLFYDWVRSGEISLEPNPILVTGPNFGCGSSREHAAWALQDHGFEVVVAPSFGDIFFSNAVQIGLVPVTLPAAELKLLMETAGELTVDLEGETITDGASRVVPFAMDPFVRHCLLHGLDAIARALQHEAEIAAFEARAPSPVQTTAL